MKVRRVGEDEIIDLPEGHTMSMGYLTVPKLYNVFYDDKDGSPWH